MARKKRKVFLYEDAALKLVRSGDASRLEEIDDADQKPENGDEPH